jgi:tryptophan-rich sensory protein
MSERESSLTVDAMKLAGCIVACQAMGLIGTIFTMPALGEWYASLTKPSFTPPGWVFSVVWVTLYTMMGVAAFLVMRLGTRRPDVRLALGAFAIQLLLNGLWPYLFFGRRDPVAGLLDICFLWIAVLMTWLRFKPLSRPATLLLTPYLLWVSFAVALNAGIVWMNR